ncbi:hypothetical protein [Micromonospora sp. SH-82]|uniref:hypothetical protein n=1 Tax=Micromonospora sp. SH-82 TaxID=3132938 RepID=UPI003EBC323E
MKAQGNSDQTGADRSRHYDAVHRRLGENTEKSEVITSVADLRTDLPGNADIRVSTSQGEGQFPLKKLRDGVSVDPGE